ncbi:hypothetical protein M011DRAFT_497106 [Sporormia fimetaria CBS 119925]|uniref:Uncharacterized protein n=1 Tax=Sporormia fimetaria CBS 119925 TaxID=1340428 RepID=A0A6A6V1A7_9PLEO|nr:hypothetical protein M011DRAFT_497106 [Sporormia fimetaria CBS 119925]
MSFLRSTTMFRASTVRPALTAARRAPVQTRWVQGYGDGKGNPASEHPEKQGKNPSENLEHPGPPPPKVAQQGKGPSPDEQDSSSSQKSESKPSSSSGGKDSTQSKDSKYGGKGPQPKILNENPPAEMDESVREHNKEMENRAERAHEQVSNEDAKKDKVSKGFWAGQGGRDRDP